MISRCIPLLIQVAKGCKAPTSRKCMPEISDGQVDRPSSHRLYSRKSQWHCLNGHDLHVETGGLGEGNGVDSATVGIHH